MSSNHFCQEILALETIIAELCVSERTDEALEDKARSLMAVKERLNSRMVEMEEYYMGRIEFYRECASVRVRELEERIETCDGRYLELLAKARGLMSRVEKLVARDRACRQKCKDE